MIGLLGLAAAAALQPQTILTVDPRHRIIEGVASDGRTIWLSSLVDRELLACTDGACKTWLTLPAGLHPLAIAWDDKRERLWVAADCPPGLPFIKSCTRGALLGYGRDGRLKTRIATLRGDFHPGDVSASPTGVFVSDSQNGAVYQFTADGKALEAVVAAVPKGSAQGTALDLDGRSLMVADYGAGIAVVDLVDGTRTLLPRAEGRAQQGIDGLARCGHVFYGVFNGATPGTLVAIQREGDVITIDKPLGEGSLPDPTQVARAGQRLLIVADSGWASMLPKDVGRTTGASVIAIDLPGDCEVE